MTDKKATRHSGHCERVKSSTINWDDPILAYGLPIVIGVGFGWPLIAWAVM